MDVYEKSLQLHEQWAGKLSTEPKCPVKSREDLSLAYTPGVAEPCRRIADNPADVYKYTQKGNTVAVVSDGSAVLGLGNIGAAAAMTATMIRMIATISAAPASSVLKSSTKLRILFSALIQSKLSFLVMLLSSIFVCLMQYFL